MNAMPVTAAEKTHERRALLTLVSVSTFVRVAYTAVIDVHDAGNAAWMQPIGGLLLSLPVFFCMLKSVPPEKPSPSTLPAPAPWLKISVLCLFWAFFTMDAGAWFYSLAESAAYSTFSEVPLLLLYAPVLLSAAIVATKGGNACGGLAKLMLYTLPILIAISLFVEVTQMHPVWLTPLFGGGFPALLRGSFACAGAFASYPAAVWVFLCAPGEPIDAKTRCRVWYSPLMSVLCAVVFAMFYGILAPNIPDAPRTREFALERLLSGGGSGTSIQFPLLICWYSFLFLCCVMNVYAATRCLKMSVDKLSLRLCAWLCAIASGVWTLLGLSFGPMAVETAYVRFAAVTALFLLLTVFSLIKRRRIKNAGA